jgi:hypothetical protein
MVKRKSRSTNKYEAEVSIEDISLEAFKQLIASGMIRDEIPFELLSTHYPSLLDNWYPGYPGVPRKMTADDPLCLDGYIKNGMVTFKDFGSGPIPIDADSSLEGEHKVWLQKDEDSFLIHVVVDNDSLSKGE